MNLRNFLIISVLAATLSGCGTRGALEPPPGAAEPDRDKPAAIDPLIKP